ncbi:fatty acid-binding protein-like [Diadema setosum]|uniref:fatty acid-binding protein-like n=1 Tax=Diadema setosum TaxID=31175 RepID=UPI003B3B63A5
MAAEGEAQVPNFTGYWKLERNDENFDKYLQEVGVNFVMRKVIKNASMYQDIEQDGNNFKLKVIMPVATQELAFTVGEEFEFYHSFRKMTIRRIAKWEGTALLTLPVSDDNDPTERRELDGEFLVLTLTKGSVSTKRYFKRATKK